MPNNQNDEWKQKELGALWKHKSSTGKVYLTGQITKAIPANTKVVVFALGKKDASDKSPDFRVYLSVPKDSAPAAPAKVNKPKPQPQPEEDVL